MLGDSALGNLAATFYFQSSPEETRFRGIVRSVEHTGAGEWFVTFTESLPLGEYLAAGAALVAQDADFVVRVSAGDDTHQFINASVGGAPADINGICAWWVRAFANQTS